MRIRKGVGKINLETWSAICFNYWVSQDKELPNFCSGYVLVNPNEPEDTN